MTENTSIPPSGKQEDPPELPEVVSLLPLRNSVLFPGSIIPIDVGRPKSVKLIEEAIANERPIIGIVTQREARVEEPTESDLHSVGCAARILKVIKLAKDNYSVSPFKFIFCRCRKSYPAVQQSIPPNPVTCSLQGFDDRLRTNPILTRIA